MQTRVFSANQECKTPAGAGATRGKSSTAFRQALLPPLVLAATAGIADAGERGAVGDLYVANERMANILQFDGLTGDFVCIFASGPELTIPFDVAWAPNGHLWVTNTSNFDAPNSVLEYDGETGQFLRYIVAPGASFLEDAEDLPCLSFGGQDGNVALVANAGSITDVRVFRIDRTSSACLGTVLEPAPPMDSNDTGRFASNGRYLLLGSSHGGPKETFNEYDGSTYQFVRNNAFDTGHKAGVIESPDHSHYLVSEERFNHNRIDLYDIATGQLDRTLVARSQCLDDPTNPCFFEVLNGPWDLAYGPNGHLYVSGSQTFVPAYPGVDYLSMGAIHEFDPQTGEQVAMFGQHDYFDGVTLDPERLYIPHGIEFKPMPGDYASAGGAFNGDWVVDLNDFEKFLGNSPFSTEPVFTGPDVPGKDAHALLSFDFDRDNDIDLADFAAFQRAFGSSIGD